MQKHVVIARFDGKTDELFREWKKEAFNLQDNQYEDAAAWPPHLTIAAFEGMNINELCNWTYEYAKKSYEIAIKFSSLGVFAHGGNSDTDIIYIAPGNSRELTDFYYGFHEKYDEHSGNYGWRYTAKYGYPVFHSTITRCKAGEFNNIFDKLRDEFIEVSGRIAALEIYENPIRLIARYELKAAL
jgi:hypothetical protein